MTAAAKTARLSILSNAVLILLKLIVGIASGAVSIISEAIHSLIDLAASLIAAFSIRMAEKPADSDHPYGHGKVENVSGVVEALMILAAAFVIIWEAAVKLIKGGALDSVVLGIVVMFASGIINWLVANRLYAVAKESESVALEADALHHKTDSYSAIGVGLGLVLLEVLKQGFHAPWAVILDPLIAIAVALFILKEALEMLLKAFAPLLDQGLGEAELALIKERVARHPGMGVHNVRSRRGGKTKYIDFHLEAPPDMSVAEVHRICDALESEIEGELRNTDVTIHVEPWQPGGAEPTA